MLIDIARRACEAAQKSGAQWAEVAVGEGREIAVEIEKNSVKSTEDCRGRSIAVRCFVNGAQGCCSAHGFDEASAIEAAKMAAATAKSTDPDPDFVALPSPEDAEEIDGLFDPKIVELGAEEVVRIAITNIDSARDIFDDVIIEGGTSTHYTRGALANSAGIAIEKEVTSFDAGFAALVKKNGDIGSFHDFDMGCTLDDVEPEALGAKATEQALRFLGARKISSGRFPIILGPLASYSFLRSIATSTNAESIQRNRSFMIGKRGKQIAATCLTIVDDGLIPRGIFSSSHDGEGAKRKRVVLIEDGVFKSYLHNSYTANKAKEENTGHSTGGGISATNIQPTLGTATAEDIIKDTKEGIYINAGGLSPDSVSGDISASIDFGFKIENGELAYPIINTMVGGHIFEFLMKIDAISSDCRREPGNLLPTMRIQDVQVAGGK